MRWPHFKLLRILLLIPVTLSLVFGLASCGASASNSPLTILSVTGGNVTVQKSGSGSWAKGKEGLTLAKGDRIKTDAGGIAAVTFFDGSIIQLNGDTEISLDELAAKSASANKTIKIGQKIGETTSSIVKLVDPTSKYEISTQSGVAAVRGSKMFVKVAADNTTSVYNIEGTISFMAQGQEVSIPVGSGSSAKPGEVPSAPKPGLPPGAGVSSGTSVSSKTGWQQTGLYVNTGDKYYVEYRGGSWTIDYKNFAYVGIAGYSDDVDKTIAAGYKFDSSAPYACLLAKVGSGKEFPASNQSGLFTADATGFLSLRINDLDASLGDNDGAISVGLRANAYSALNEFSMTNNPNIAWSWGWMPTDFSKFNLYTTHNSLQWYGPQGGDLTPCIWINNGGPAYGVPTGWLSIHPGPGREPSVLRWTAPVAGTISVKGQFLAGDGGIMSVDVRHNNLEVWKASDAGSFDLTLKVAIGDTVDFAVFGGYGYGNTPISAVISYSN